MTIQTMSLHWQNHQKMENAGLHKHNNDDWKMNNKKMPDEPPEGSWQTKVPLGCAISMEYLQLSYGQGQAPSS